MQVGQAPLTSHGHEILKGTGSPLPAPQSFPEPEEVRRLGELIHENDEEDRRPWSITWKGVDMIVKGGETVCKEEAELTRLARESTGLPVPAVFGIKQESQATYIYFEKLPGTRFCESDFLNLPAHIQQALRRDLEDVLGRLRSLSPPQGLDMPIGGPGSHPLAAIFADENVEPPSPLRSPSNLRRFLHKRAQLASPKILRQYEREIEPALRREDDTPVVFVHGDLNPSNILVDVNTGTVTGVVDWARAGWYPAWVETFVLVNGAVVRTLSWEFRLVAELAHGRKAKPSRRTILYFPGAEWMVEAGRVWLA
ncbi:hypothetical protein JCM10207_004808 [Rhodosporidiobolus poonsookiae]